MGEKSTPKKSYKKGIKEWPLEDRPREKLLLRGEHTLSDAELLAILLRTGNKGESALDLARRILGEFGTFRNMSHVHPSRWREFKGLGEAKIAQIRAALEIGRRFREETLKERKVKITSSRDVAEIYLPRMRDLKKEVFKVVFLNSKNFILHTREITEGTTDSAYPIIREIFSLAFQYFATGIICLHNHPSGDPSPSREDKEFTRRLKEVGEALQVRVLDHLIFGDNTYFSFADEGLI